MHKFIAYVDQQEGCDCTISCGKVLWELSAKTFSEAEQEVIDIIEEEYTHEELRIKNSITIYEVFHAEELAPNDLYQRIDDEERLKTLKASEDEEYRLYQRLKEKYG